MADYRCSQCKTVYSHTEYMALDKASRVTDDPNDKYGVESVCECGSKFHSDKWTLREELDVGGEEIEVSTVALTIPHGPDHNHWYESCVFHDTGSRIVERYETQAKAEKGHEKTVSALTDGKFSFEPTGRKLVLEQSE